MGNLSHILEKYNLNSNSNSNSKIFIRYIMRYIYIVGLFITRGPKLGASLDTMIYVYNIKSILDGPNMLSKLLDINSILYSDSLHHYV